MTKPLLRNAEGGGWIVQKFGGTSVGKFPNKIAEDIVRRYLSSGSRVVVVCSARSAGKKVAGTTSRLLEVVRRLQLLGPAAAASDEPAQAALVAAAQQLIQDICNEHVFTADASVADPALRAALREELEAECRELAEYVAAIRRFNLEVNARAKDRVVSFGEKLSCRFMAYVLRASHVDAEYVDLSDALHAGSMGGSQYDRLDAAFYKAAAAAFRRKLAACGDRVPVVTGFFGNVPGSLVDGDVGRGYTDLCAALVAVALPAQELQVWKEVDGIFTADPSKVPTARLIPSITPSEAAELTFYGSEVIHHLTMDQVVKATPPIPVRIKNVKNPRGNGTIVLPDPVRAPGQQLQRSARGSFTANLPAAAVAAVVTAVGNGTPTTTTTTTATNAAADRTTPRRPTAVTIKDRISVLNIHSNKRSLAHGFVARVFSVLDEHQISVDLIATSEVHVSMAIHAPNVPPPAELGAADSHLERARRELGALGDVSLLHGMAILSLVGADMKNMIGVAGKMFSTLGEHNINIEMISQGASEINISCVIDAQEATRAMNVLHTNLFTFLD
ncbi:cohesin complex subunit [Niveomyces insectorum RCEF 264]|uniref:Aspartokinase n=1 Tax=Niveomyces insectorum RCEF 264 TaxID=1081102 RepID=A0A167X5E2_9HYPO|nr:cohesin complex subunit [Niveomyces insectorum RCEF 264]